MTKVIWTDYAKESLQLTVDFLETQWGSEFTDELINLIDKRITQVTLNPSIAPFLEGTTFKRLVIHKNLTILYTIIPDAIKIVLVWDSRQDPDKLEQILISNKNI